MPLTVTIHIDSAFYVIYIGGDVVFAVVVEKYVKTIELRHCIKIKMRGEKNKVLIISAGVRTLNNQLTVDLFNCWEISV